MQVNVIYQAIFLFLGGVLLICHLYYPKYELISTTPYRAFIVDKLTGELKTCENQDVGGNRIFLCEKVPDR